jgi:hypothetical protein
MYKMAKNIECFMTSSLRYLQSFYTGNFWREEFCRNFYLPPLHAGCRVLLS